MAKSLKHYREQAEKALVDLAWTQWNRLGLYGAGKASRASTDIEAAIALVCLVGWLDGRLFDGTLSWIHEYHDIVSGDRLKFFIKNIDDPFLPRCIGAVIESAAARKDAARWKYFLQTIEKSLPQRKNEKGTIFWYSRARESWTKRDAAFKKWGFAKEETVLSSKLKRHDEILRTNQQIKYRYMFGNTARADVIYLLAVAGSTGLMTADLSSLTGYNHSSVFRILKDLSRSGFVQSLGEEGSKRASWCIRTTNADLLDNVADSALINWKNVVPMCYTLLKEMHRIESIKNELVAKHACFSLYENALKVFRASGFARLPHVPAEPLENIKLTDLLEIPADCIKSMENMISD